LACFKYVARSPPRHKFKGTLTKFHNNYKRTFEVKRFNILDNKRIQIIIAKFLEYLSLERIIHNIPII